MKGIAHFISGVTVASFCPWAIEAAQNGNPVFFILGAVAGILPDTIDFKFYRFFYPHDVVVDPDPHRLDPRIIADAFAAAISQTAESGDTVRIKLSTIRMSADNWRQYQVRIDSKAQEVRVQFGPVVSTGQVPQPGSLPVDRPVAIAPFSAPVRLDGESLYAVDIFDGPSFMFKRDADGEVEIDFLPWHRNGSHSLIAGLFLAGLVSLWTWKAGAVVFGAYSLHIIEDQLGYMGSNLFFPFTRKRMPGLKWMRSGDAIPNFTTVWLCCLLIFWNLYAAAPTVLYHFTFIRFIMVAFIVPFVFFNIVRWILSRAGHASSESSVIEWRI